MPRLIRFNGNPSFPQRARSKSVDGFGPFGPVIATGSKMEELWVRTILNGEERQHYPASDIVFPVGSLVSRLSRDVTSLPGDLIRCGTSLGVGSMREAVNQVEIGGIGTLRNEFVSG